LREEKTKKLLIAYYSKTGNTKKIAASICEGAKSVSGVNVEFKNVESIDAKEVLDREDVLIQIVKGKEINIS